MEIYAGDNDCSCGMRMLVSAKGIGGMSVNRCVGGGSSVVGSLLMVSAESKRDNSAIIIHSTNINQ